MAQFITANKEVDDFLKRQKGFRSRTIFELNKGVVHDLLVWHTAEDGFAAMHLLMDELSESPVHGMINQGTVSWKIAPAQHFVTL